MVSLTVVFWLLVILFALIGTMRGWAKEIMVTASVILALFLITVLEKLGPLQNTLFKNGGEQLFWFRAIVLSLLTFFGYQTPNIRGMSGPRFARERFQDALLGMILGAVNGYMIFGTTWWFMAEADYPFEKFIQPPVADAMGEAAARLLGMMPPTYLTGNWIFLAVGIAFLFVIVVFV